MGTDGPRPGPRQPDRPRTTSSTATLHDRLLESGLAAADRDGVHGKDVTPFLLDCFHRETGGESLRANVALVRSNARLAAEVATAYAAAGAVVTVYCLGDLMVDVVARLFGPLAEGSDSPARDRATSAAGRPPTPRPG